MNVPFRSTLPPTEPSRAGRTAFTLIEILATVVVIVILVALLFPMAKRMIEKSQSATCMGNLRTLWTGANLYAADNNGFLPWAAQSASIRWETEIAPYVGDYKIYHRWNDEWHRSGPFTCPATAKNWWLGYGWNYNGVGHGPVPADPPPDRTPSSYTRSGPTRAGSKPKVVMIADSYYASNPTETVPQNNNMLRPPSAAGPGNTPDVPRPHTDGLNTIFVDGHVEWHPADTWYENTIWE